MGGSRNTARIVSVGGIAGPATVSDGVSLYAVNVPQPATNNKAKAKPDVRQTERGIG
ncbi:MAG: hypothetical protein AAFX76_13980 [Planctomycetota bacterium]